MEGKVVSFRRGLKTQHKYQMIVKVEGVDNKEKAIKLIDKQVSWKSPKGKEIKGTVTNTHGNKGALRVRFEKGLPGQSLGTKVELN
ncbi:50S ribosomal protein L35ae [Candidatus Woesearchaeota archaeon]|nr:50S ribosomal protein L35ae [Candidatus Woesearchaeota archaeon]